MDQDSQLGPHLSAGCAKSASSELRPKFEAGLLLEMVFVPQQDPGEVACQGSHCVVHPLGQRPTVNVKRQYPREEDSD